MRTVDDIERLWLALPPSPRERGSVDLITIRLGGGRHECPPRVAISPELGVHGDRWSLKPRRVPDAQVTLMNVRVARLLTEGTAPLDASGDNFLVDLDVSHQALPAGTRLSIGGAVIEVSALPHSGCKFFKERMGAAALEWVNAIPNRPRRLRGVNCRVVTAGEVALGDPVRFA